MWNQPTGPPSLWSLHCFCDKTQTTTSASPYYTIQAEDRNKSGPTDHAVLSTSKPLRCCPLAWPPHRDNAPLYAARPICIIRCAAAMLLYRDIYCHQGFERSRVAPYCTHTRYLDNGSRRRFCLLVKVLPVEIRSENGLMECLIVLLAWLSGYLFLYQIKVAGGVILSLGLYFQITK